MSHEAVILAPWRSGGGGRGREGPNSARLHFPGFLAKLGGACLACPVVRRGPLTPREVRPAACSEKKKSKQHSRPTGPPTAKVVNNGPPSPLGQGEEHALDREAEEGPPGVRATTQAAVEHLLRYASRHPPKKESGPTVATFDCDDLALRVPSAAVRPARLRLH